MQKQSSRDMLKDALALLLAVRCGQKDAVKQLLHSFYHRLDEQQSKLLMNRAIYLMTPKERDWMKSMY